MLIGMTTASKERKPGFFARMFGKSGGDMQPLYLATVAEARQPRWYRDHGVPDTIDGRFDMVALVLSLVMLRLERAGHEVESVQLTELFITDMDGQIRESGYGDLVVGKQLGGILAVLGGRLGAYRQAVDAETLTRTLWRGTPPADIDAAMREITALHARIDTLPIDALLAGRLA